MPLIEKGIDFQLFDVSLALTVSVFVVYYVYISKIVLTVLRGLQAFWNFVECPQTKREHTGESNSNATVFMLKQSC